MRYSIDQLAAIRDIGHHIETLESLAGDLKTALRNCSLIEARVSTLPRPIKREETEQRERIEPDLLTGTAAFEQALYALTDWYGDGEHSTKTVTRYPGAVVLNASAPAVRDISRGFDEANRIKDEIRRTIPLLGNQDDRFKLLHDHHHMLVTLQLLRHWTLLPPAPAIQSLTFTWGAKTEIRRVSVEEAKRRIRQRLDDPLPEGLSRAQWEWEVDKEVAKVGALPKGTELRYRRQLVVRPLVNVRYAQPDAEDANQPRGLLREAHTPVFTLNPERSVRVRTLGVYDAAKRQGRKKREDRRASQEPVTWLLPIFPVRPST